MIRVATPDDAVALAGVQHRAWWRAYADYVDPERFKTLEELVARWHELLASAAGRRRATLVFDQSRQVAGFATFGPTRDDDATPGTGELMAVYVDPPAQGAGVGRALLDAADARLREQGSVEVVVWVFAANAMARELYERRGWVLDPSTSPARQGSAGGPAVDWWAPAVRYRRRL